MKAIEIFSSGSDEDGIFSDNLLSSEEIMQQFKARDERDLAEGTVSGEDAGTTSSHIKGDAGIKPLESAD